MQRCPDTSGAIGVCKPNLRCRGVGLVHVMGRHSGFIAMMASLASGVVDVCLIPEVKFTTPRLLAHISSVLQRQGHCVICVAEGAGQVRPGLFKRNPISPAYAGMYAIFPGICRDVCHFTTNQGVFQPFPKKFPAIPPACTTLGAPPCVVLRIQY